MVSRSAVTRHRSPRRGVGRASARETALRTFLDWDAGVETADLLLGQRLGEARLHGRERDLAWELVRGVFRWRGRLDWQLGVLVDRPLADLHPPILWILRLGLYQLEHLDRVPPHAACDTSVELAKRYGHRGSASLVNAVLRRAPDALADLAPPDPGEDPVRHLVARTSHPAWLLERWLDRIGFRKTLTLAAAGNERPSLTLRITSDRVDAAGLLEDLRAQGIDAEPGCLLPGHVRIPGGWCPELRPILEAGMCVVQDEAAGLVAHLALPAGRASILDVCAAPGGKAFALAELCGEAQVVACDVSARRLGALRETAERLGRAAHLVVADGRAPATRGGFARVLVDAPCTNTGVLAKRPDARWRRQPEDVPRLAKLQGELLDAAREQVGPGGLLVYSTCSLEPEENEDVIRDYLRRHPSDAIVPASGVLPTEVVEGDFLRTDPTALPLDGAFGAAIRPGGAALKVIG
jgi:16S rRNA (cytosine967-C5)-methyltransferase